MKNNLKNMSFLLLPLACLGLMACHGNKTEAVAEGCDTDSVAVESTEMDADSGPLEVEQYKYDKSTKYASVTIDVTVPSGTDEASAAMRSSLMAAVDAFYGTDMEGERCIARYSGDMANVKKCITYYGAPSVTRLSAECRDNIEEMRGDGTEDGEAADVDVEPYDMSITITKGKYETASLVVFDIQNTTFFGGAHPNGSGYSMTFDRTTGKELKKFFVAGAQAKLQTIMRNGLVKYFRDCGENVNSHTLYECLMIDGKTIPLPACTPCPTKNGLVFTYQQYEIAAYAYGMPSFEVPYSQIAPYLTYEAKALLGL